jgi:hypothetical protein
METKRRPFFARRWLLFWMVLLFGGIGFLIGYQKHVLWLGILLAVLGAAYAWLLWVMMRIAMFTILGALVGAVALGLARSNLWFVGALVGACLGFLVGHSMHKRALVRGKVSP